MKKIIINGMEIFGDDEPHGPQRFGMEIVYALDHICNLNIEIVLPKNLKNNTSISLIRNLKVTFLNYDINNWKGRFLFSKIVFPNYVKKKNGIGVDLVLSFPLYNTEVVSIYDCIIKEHPEECKKIKDKWFRVKFLFLEKNSIKKSKLIFTISNYSKNKIIKLYNVPSNKIVIVGTGWNHMMRIQEDNLILKKYGLIRKNYYFCAGVGIGRKNFEWIYEAARQNDNSIFVVSGNNKNVQDNLKCKNIIFTGFVSDAEFKSLMINARAYIQPSLEEGFGMSPLEALGVGTEIIISDIPVFREIYGNAGHYINPQNYQNIILDDILSSPVSGINEILRKYTWENSAKVIIDSINERLM